MKNIDVVIGSNYGDEGKGRTTNYLATKYQGKNCAVVRFNGGAQAGHTVVSGKYRHVFSHFGSASFDLIPTIFTSDFVCSPYLFKKENEQLIRKSIIRPALYVSPNCPVTTPWDMWINQLIEAHRGPNRHGSVGVGFGETLERHQNEKFRLTVADIADPKIRIKRINEIASKYAKQRMAEQGIRPVEVDELNNWIFKNIDQIIDMFEAECEYFLKRVIIIDEAQAMNRFDSLVFEGAQGLALDQESPDFPHVTRSFTGIDNVLKALSRAEIEDKINLTYVTRPYLTRHGAGPLKNELDDQAFSKFFAVIDETNKPHEFQGLLRFAIMDIDDAVARITKDQFKIARSKIGEITLAVTCLDQIANEDGFPAQFDGKTYMFTDKSFASAFASRINASKVIICRGEEDWMITEGRLIDNKQIKETYGEEDEC